jgi:hypothetical protein
VRLSLSHRITNHLNNTASASLQHRDSTATAPRQHRDSSLQHYNSILEHHDSVTQHHDITQHDSLFSYAKEGQSELRYPINAMRNLARSKVRCVLALHMHIHTRTPWQGHTHTHRDTHIHTHTHTHTRTHTQVVSSHFLLLDVDLMPSTSLHAELLALPEVHTLKGIYLSPRNCSISNAMIAMIRLGAACPLEQRLSGACLRGAQSRDVQGRYE